MEAVSLAGKTLHERYRVVRPLGRGALATVYLAFDPFGTPYALKVFPKGAEARRDRELWVGKRLSHPNLNPVLEALDLEEGPALLLAYAPGEEMGRWMLRRPERRRALFVFRQLLEALAHMHEKGLVHRDVKPENLIVAGTDEARLVDFDLSGPALETFKRPLRLGTLPYLAPEQVLGKSPEPEPTSTRPASSSTGSSPANTPLWEAPRRCSWATSKERSPLCPTSPPRKRRT